jgi:hypothetical protein
VLLHARCSSAVEKPAFRKHSEMSFMAGFSGCRELRPARADEPPHEVPRLPEGTRAALLEMIVAEAKPHRSTSCALRLGVVAHARTSGEAWLVDRDSEGMVLVGVVRASRVKREDVKGIGVRDAIRDGGREVIGRIEDEPSALRGKHLQTQVAGPHPLRKRYALQEFLVVKGSKPARIRHTQRVDTIEGDAGLPKTRRDRDD